MRTSQRLAALVAAGVVIAGGGLLAVGVGATISASNTSAPVTPSTLPGEATSTPTTVPPITLPQPVPPPADNEAEPQQYYGRIQIPAIEVDSPLLEGIRLSTLDNGPGHWPGTAMPGELGNVVVAGHRTSHNADFRRLDELEPGDEVIFDLDDDDEGLPTATVVDPDPYSGVFVYRVVEVQIVGPEAMWVVNQNPRHEATLFACHPPGSVAERIIVFLDLESPAPAVPDPPRPTVAPDSVAPTTGG